MSWRSPWLLLLRATDMVDREYFDHTNRDGLSPWDRMDLAGYDWSASGENIAAGSPEAAGTMQQWMSTDVPVRDVGFRA